MVTIAAIALGVGAILIVVGWNWLQESPQNAETNSATIRNIGLIVAALASGLLVMWRNVLATREADAAQRQVEIAERNAEVTLSQTRLTRELAEQQHESGQRQAELVREQFETARAQAQQQYEMGQRQAEIAREQAEQQAEVARRLAEQQVELVRPQAEAAREQAAAMKQQAETAREQAGALREQVETARAAAERAQQDILEDRYRQGTESLSNESATMRMNGIDELYRLALEAPEPFPSQIIDRLCDFVRHSEVRDADARTTPEDIERAVKAAANIYQTLRQLDQATTVKLDFSQAALNRASLWEIDFSGATFEEAEFWGVQLSDAILVDAYLVEADLTGALFMGTNLAGANLGFSTAYLANFRRADLTGASLRSVGLAGADFTDAVLAGANLTGARFVPLRDEYSDLAGFVDYETYESPREMVAEGLTQEQLDAAVADPELPPLLDELLDAETGEPLVWRGGPVPETEEADVQEPSS